GRWRRTSAAVGSRPCRTLARPRRASASRRGRARRSSRRRSEPGGGGWSWSPPALKPVPELAEQVDAARAGGGPEPCRGGVDATDGAVVEGRTGIADARAGGGDGRRRDAAGGERRQAGGAGAVLADAGVVEKGAESVLLQGGAGIAAEEPAMRA